MEVDEEDRNMQVQYVGSGTSAVGSGMLECRFNIQMTEFRKSISMEWIIRMVHPQNV